MSLESLKKRRQFIHEVVQEEFRNVLENARYELLNDTEAIVVLSLSPRGWHTESNKHEDHPEDVACVTFSAEVYKRYIAKRLNKSVDELTTDDLRDESWPVIILDGATEQLEMMERIALNVGVPKEKIILLNCGDHAVANTKTQFTELVKDSKTSKYKKIAVISANYHIPRVARTASVNLPQDMDFDVLGIPFKDHSFNVYRNTKKEMKKIIEYSKKGDVSKYPRNKEKS